MSTDDKDGTLRRLTFGALLLLGGAAALSPASDGDIWWHLAAGREMVRQGAVLTTDPFSADAAGRPWIDVHWLFQLLVYGGHRLGGLLGLAVAKAVVIAAGAGILLLAVERGAQADAGRDTNAGDTGDAATAARLILVPLLLGTLLAVRPLLLLRPVVLTLLFLALFCWVVERYRARGEARLLWLLPALQIVWVNCQGLSPLGPALILCHAAGGAAAARWGRRELPVGGARRLLAAAAGCLAAGLITPFGLNGLLFPLRLLSRLRPTDANIFSRNIAENVPPFLLERAAPGQLWHLPWFLALLALSFLVGRRHLVIGRSLAAVSFLALGLLATRNLLLAYWIAAPIVALNLAPAMARWLLSNAAGPHRRRWIPPAFGLGMLALAAVTVVALRRDTPVNAPAPFRVPAGATAIIADRAGQGTIFAADHYGGYLIWTLFPRFRPFIDTRLILRTPAEYENFLAVLADPNRFDALADKHAFAYALLPTAFPDRYLRLVQHLYRAPHWKLIHTDGTETLFVHDPNSVEAGIDLRSREVTAGLISTLDGQHRADAGVRRAALLQLARLQLVLGHVDQAKQVLNAAPAGDVEVLSLRALADLMAGDLAAAEATARAAAAAGPQVTAPLNLLARVAFERGDRDNGLAWLRRALSLDPHDADALSLLDNLEAQHPAGDRGKMPPAAP